MAQILNYHKTTNNTQFNNGERYYHNYSGRQFWIDDDYADNGFPSFEDLNLYLDTISLHFQNNITYVYSTMMNLSTPTFVTEGSVKFLSEDSFNKMYDWMLNNPSPNADMQNFKNMFGSLKAMVNPAMFTKVSAGKAQMLGTYDTDLAKYYKYDAGLLTATDISSEAKKIYDYDTSDDKQLYIPFDVVGAVIKVE